MSEKGRLSNLAGHSKFEQWFISSSELFDLRKVACTCVAVLFFVQSIIVISQGCSSLRYDLTVICWWVTGYLSVQSRRPQKVWGQRRRHILQPRGTMERSVALVCLALICVASAVRTSRIFIVIIVACRLKLWCKYDIFDFNVQIFKFNNQVFEFSNFQKKREQHSTLQVLRWSLVPITRSQFSLPLFSSS